LIQPDIVINRFFHGDKYQTHGHHSSSAILSTEAFDLSGDPNQYPEQLSLVAPWQPKRIFFNTSWWFYGSREKFEEADKTNLYTVDIGVYLPLKGKSNTELAQEARSKHRCQGFGALSYRGETEDWLEFIKGQRPSTEGDPFSGINTSWTRLDGGAPIGEKLKEIERNYRADNPAASVSGLIEAMQMIKKLPDSKWKRTKLNDIKEVIKGCLGLYLEATASESTATPGETIQLHMEAINRSGMSIELGGLMINHQLKDTILGFAMEDNKLFEYDTKIQIPDDANFTAPYWLNEGATLGMYYVPDQELRGLPETPRYLSVRWSFVVNGVPLEYTTDVAYKERQPAKGEIWQPFEILPPVFVEFEQPNYLITGKSQDVIVTVRAGKDNVSGKLMVTGPKGWPVGQEEGKNEFSFKRKGEEKQFTCTVFPNSGPDEVTLEAFAQVGDVSYGKSLQVIDYDHIPKQNVLQPAVAKAARVDLACFAKKVGYYMGAGDDVPEALKLMGCEVITLTDDDINAQTLNDLDALVIGIRAYNTQDAIRFHNEKFLEYVKQGGTMVVQYNTNGGMKMEDIAPYPMQLSRDRVTEEDAEMRILLPSHPVLNTPNKISQKDFDGWVQERGLYFPNVWDERYQAPLSSNDKGEGPLDGSLLVSKYGKGHYVYTGLSFFRELPAGVPGAYRLFANLISLGNQTP
jgi:hypothetical protein